MPTITNLKKLFIDTNIFVALHDKDDSTHTKANQLLDIVEEEQIALYTSSDVIGETLTVIAKKLGKAAARDFLETYKASDIKEIFVDEEMHSETRKLFLSITSKTVSFIDCSNVIAMKQEGIRTIFTFDRDFKKFDVALFGEK